MEEIGIIICLKNRNKNSEIERISKNYREARKSQFSGN